jgi:hypothetical protein
MGRREDERIRDDGGKGAESALWVRDAVGTEADDAVSEFWWGVECAGEGV